MALEPITRQEKIIAGQDLEPITRKEMFLKNFGGGGAGQFIVTVYNTNPAGTKFAADKTYDEISAAIESGKEVVIHKKKNINSADYSVFYPCDFLRGSYQFCNSMLRFGETPNIYARFISIGMENGEMQIAIFSYNLQTVT